MGFADALKTKAAPVWEKIFHHPFVVGIGDGSLPVEKFRFYIGQDYVFLIEYSRVLALAVAKGPHLDTMGRFARLLDATLNTEMALHRSYAAQFGLSEEELAHTAAAPTTHAYTRYLLEVAYAGTLEDIVAALVPCQWGYWEIGRRLARQGEPSGQPLYAQWIRTYASEDFGALAQWLCSLLDKLAEGAKPSALARMEEYFLTSSRYEYLFWEMAYRQEQWPV